LVCWISYLVLLAFFWKHSVWSLSLTSIELWECNCGLWIELYMSWLTESHVSEDTFLLKLIKYLALIIVSCIVHKEGQLLLPVWAILLSDCAVWLPRYKTFLNWWFTLLLDLHILIWLWIKKPVWSEYLSSEVVQLSIINLVITCKILHN